MRQLKFFNGQKQEKPQAAAGQNVDEMLKQYSGMDEDALISQLVESVRRSRANGTYNPGQLENFAQMLSPHISADQREKLENIIRIINQENV